MSPSIAIIHESEEDIRGLLSHAASWWFCGLSRNLDVEGKGDADGDFGRKRSNLLEEVPEAARRKAQLRIGRPAFVQYLDALGVIP